MAWSPQQEQAIKAVKVWLRAKSSAQIFYLAGFAGTGKEQPLDAMIQTPMGPIRMGDIQVGDVICGATESTTVTGVFPQGTKPVYRVKFRDGSETRCGLSHLWKVQSLKDRAAGRWRVLPLADLISKGLRYDSGPYKWQIPLCRPVEFALPKPRFDAYTMGVLIGDGALGGSVVEFINPDRQIAERVAATLPKGMTMKETNYSSCPHFALQKEGSAYRNPWRQHLRELGVDCVSKLKFIPSEYLMAPIVDRVALLRGLMDTDGSCSGNRTSFSTSSPALAIDLVRLVQSLGGTAISKRYERDGSGEFQINVKTFFNPFFLERKAQEWSVSAKNPASRYIVSIEKVGYEPQQCISVAASDSLYLTDDFIVTHNTTLAKELAGGVKGKVLYGAFTGKAALVLRKKGCDGASTIHSMIYRKAESEEMGYDGDGAPVEDDDDNPRFIVNPQSPASTAKLIIIDECSMVDEELGRDLLSFGVKVLVLGDPAQLPPVKGDGFFTARDPDFMLTEVHRQAADNPIIRMSMTVREGGRLDYGAYGSSRVIRHSDLGQKIVLGADQVLVGLNKTRETVNTKMRRLLGFSGIYPVVGERLICLRNDKEKKLLNGGLWNVDKIEECTDSGIKMLVKSEDFPNEKPATVFVLNGFFTGREKDIPWPVRRGTQEFTFGHAITCHKSQGSQWENVLIFDESASFREEAKRWIYTAITRAADRVTIVL